MNPQRGRQACGHGQDDDSLSAMREQEHRMAADQRSRVSAQRHRAV